jgi:hypothetical protein
MALASMAAAKEYDYAYVRRLVTDRLNRHVSNVQVEWLPDEFEDDSAVTKFWHLANHPDLAVLFVEETDTANIDRQLIPAVLNELNTADVSGHPQTKIVCWLHVIHHLGTVAIYRGYSPRAGDAQ